MKANVNDRASIEGIYPPDTFQQDATRNSVGDASVLRGLRVMSQPDETGAFDIVAVKRQVGERDPEGDTVFVPAFLKGGIDAPGQKASDYTAYIDQVLEVARSVDFKVPIGQDRRLAGFHGG